MQPVFCNKRNMVDLKTNIVTKHTELFAVSAILCGFMIFIPAVLRFHGQISLPILLGIILAVNSVVAVICVYLLYLYGNRIYRIEFHKEVKYLHNTILELNRVSKYILEAAETLPGSKKDPLKLSEKYQVYPYKPHDD